MKYRHSFMVQAPVEAVAAFHRDARSMAEITPPPVIVRFQKSPAQMEQGAEIRFTLWFGLLPVRWAACIEEVTPGGFVDRQVEGPFQRWVHRHSFLPNGEGGSEVRDEVELQLKGHPFWGLFGLGMRLSLPVLFFYRAWKTRRLLARLHAQ